jgi:DNA-binding transcriptional LysR family regulator
MRRVASDIRMSDLLTFLAVQRTGSVTGAARELSVTPSQVSKAVSRLERHWGLALLSRGARGIQLTDPGRRIVPQIAAAVSALREAESVKREPDPAVRLTIAAPSYLLAFLVPVIAAADPRMRVRGLELAPAYLRAYVAENVFDVALAPGGIANRPKAWTSDSVGAIRAVLLGTPATARRLAPLPAPAARLAGFPFILPTATSGDRFVALSDDCPLPREERTVGHEVHTVGVALELALRTDHLVFGPAIAARRMVASGMLVEIPVADWDVREELHLLCNGDVVLARVRRMLIDVVRNAVASQV